MKVAASRSVGIFTTSVRRFLKVLLKHYRDINAHLKEGKEKHLQKVKEERLAHNKPKYKKIFKLRSRNKYAGRKNYYRFQKQNSLEMQFEKKQQLKARLPARKRKHLYPYYMLQKTLNKALLKFQPRFFPKKIFDAKLWLQQTRNAKFSFSISNQIMAVQKLINYIDYAILSAQDKLSNNLPVHSNELFLTFSALYAFKKRIG